MICRHARTTGRCLRCAWGAGKPGNVILDLDDPRLSPVPSVRGKHCLAHHTAVDAFGTLNATWQAETGHSALLVTSGWRGRRWAKYRQYVAELVRRYAGRLPKGSTRADVIAYGRRYLAWESIHFSGLAIDLGSHGLEPRSATNAAQAKTEASRWLDGYIERQRGLCGWTRYQPEPWHLEYFVPRALWASASEQPV